VRADLWSKAKQPTKDTAQRSRQFRLLVALAALDPENADWPQVAVSVVEQFLAANPLHVGTWKAALEPVRRALLVKFAHEFRTQ
jgi:hypothetical protein